MRKIGDIRRRNWVADEPYGFFSLSPDNNRGFQMSNGVDYVSMFSERCSQNQPQRTPSVVVCTHSLWGRTS